MTAFRSPVRRAAAGLTAVAIFALGGCTGDQAGPVDGTDRPGTTMPATETTVRYENDTLVVGGVPLRQFPGYQKAVLEKMYLRWATQDALVLVSTVERSAHPVLRAAVFEDGAVTDPLVPIADAEWNFGDSFPKGEVVAEGTVAGGDRVCHFRVRSGQLDDADRPVRTVLGTVIATGGGRPAVGVSVDDLDVEPIEKLTREIADALCQPPGGAPVA